MALPRARGGLCRRGGLAARRELCGVALGLAGVEYAQPAADLLAFALALPMGLSVLKTFRSDAPTPAHTLREE